MKRALLCVLGFHLASFSVFSEHWHCDRCMWMQGLKGGWVPPDRDKMHAAAVKSFLAATPEERAEIIAAMEGRDTGSTDDDG